MSSVISNYGTQFPLLTDFINIYAVFINIAWRTLVIFTKNRTKKKTSKLAGSL